MKDVKPVDTSGGLKRNCIGKSQVLVQHCRSFHDGPQPHPIRPGITQKFSTRSCRATTLTLTLSIIFVCHAFFYSSRIYYFCPTYHSLRVSLAASSAWREAAMTQGRIKEGHLESKHICLVQTPRRTSRSETPIQRNSNKVY